MHSDISGKDGPQPEPNAERDTAGRPQGSGTSEGWVLFINTIADRVDPIVKLLTAWMEQSLKAKQSENRFQAGMAWVAVSVVLVVVSVAGGLTYTGHVDGSTFTFLLGLVVGYVLTFVRDAIQPDPSSE